MVSSRFYRPRMAVLTAKELKFLGLAEEAGLNYFIPSSSLATRKLVSTSNLPPGVRISYSFSHAIRNNWFLKASGKGVAQYGTSGISFRLLYEFLCESFNGGEYFIDTYFEKIFDTRSVSKRLNRLNYTISNDIENEMSELYKELVYKKNGELDLRYGVNKKYMSLEVWNNPTRKSESTLMAKEIQEDIQSCLMSGRIPLRKSAVTEKTLEKRKQLLGIFGNKFFYASGQLIEHLQIFIELSEVE